MADNTAATPEPDAAPATRSQNEGPPTTEPYGPVSGTRHPAPAPTEDGEQPKQRPGWLKILLFGAIIVALVIGIPWGLSYWRFASTHVSTDDAYVTGNLVIVSPVISGTLEKLTVDEG